MNPNIYPCKYCRTTQHLKSKWNSDNQTCWVHCDGCGNGYQYVAGNGREALEKWNEANKVQTEKESK